MSDANIDSGPVTWQSQSNHNHMMELQRRTGSAAVEGPVELAHFGNSAFRITSPQGFIL